MIRLGVSILLAGTVLMIFLMSRSTPTSTPDPPKKELTQSFVSIIDHDVDSILTRFKIEKAWIKKNAILLPNINVKRIEWRVTIPTTIVPVQLNVAFNAMAKRYNGRAVASENLKENSVTIHIEMLGYIVQTIILKTDPDLKRVGKKDEQKKV